ncbi:MAG: glycosyltransferase family 2 protein [Bacteriovoracia bacterium]
MVYILFAIYNRKALTLECLRCISALKGPAFRVVIFDDGSTDGSGDAIRAEFPDVQVLRGPGDWWWTKSMNAGLRHILERAQDGDYVMTLNDDTEFGPDFLQTLMDVSVSQDRAVVGSVARNFFERNHVEDSGYRIDWQKYLFNKVPYAESPPWIEVDTLACRGTLIPIELFRRLGLFDQTTLPHYAADMEFFIRAKRAGYRLLMSRQAAVYHKDRAGLGGQPPRPAWSKFKDLFSIRSSNNLRCHLTLILKYSPSASAKLLNSARLLKRSLQTVMTS